MTGIATAGRDGRNGPKHQPAWMERSRAEHVLRCLGDPDYDDFGLTPAELAKVTDACAYVSALCDGAGPFPLATFRLPTYVGCFQAMRVHIRAHGFEHRLPFALEHRCRKPLSAGGVVTSFGEILAPEMLQLEALASAREIAVEWRTRSDLESAQRDFRGLSGNREVYDVQLAASVELATWLIGKPGRLALGLSEERGKVSFGFHIRPRAIECQIFGKAENVNQALFHELLGMIVAAEAFGGRIEVKQSFGSHFELSAAVPFPELREERTLEGHRRAEVIAASLTAETGSRWHVTDDRRLRSGRAEQSVATEHRQRFDLIVDEADRRYIDGLRATVMSALKDRSKPSLGRTAGVREQRTAQRRLRELGLTYKADVEIPVRMKLAGTLLKRGLHPKEVAHRVGYADRSHFEKVFLDWHGVRPSQFRERSRKPKPRHSASERG